jgi:flagellar motor protein MotB
VLQRASRRTRRTEAAGESYWISFTDLMSALLFIFILAVVVLVLQLAERQAELTSQRDQIEQQQVDFNEQISTLQQAESVREDMLLEISEELRAQGIEVLVTENNSVLSIPSESLGFAATSYELSESYEPRALTIGTVISEAIRQDDRLQYLDTVFVEGHTDNLDFDGLEGTGNWGLSTFRAISLWSFLESALPGDQRLGQLENTEGKPLFSVSGYADTRPVQGTQKTDEQRALNRRIDIRFTIVRPSSDDLVDISKTLEGELP